MELFEKYIQYVQTNPQKVGELVRLAISRHIADLSCSNLYFDNDAAADALHFIGLLRHTKGASAGKRFNLQPWQAFFIGSIFGWKNKDTQLRRFRTVYLQVGRKNGKSELAAAIALYMGVMDGEAGAEVYSAATTEKQAGLMFKAAKKMSDRLRRESKRYARLVEKSQTTKIIGEEVEFSPVSSDSHTLDGLNPHLACIDEFHEHRDDTIPEVMRSGMVARDQPMLLYTTTAGRSLQSPCYELRKFVGQVLRGEKTDESLFALVYEPDEGDEERWWEEDVWYKSNPNLGVSVYLNALRIECNDAKNRGHSKQRGFMIKNLNMWLNVAKGWLPTSKWQELADSTVTLDNLEGRKCYGGLDVASTRDLTAFSLFFPAEYEGDVHRLLTFLWVPIDNAIERQEVDQVAYVDWVHDGYIKATEGDAIDSSAIADDILAILSKVACVSIAKDRAFSSHVSIALQTHGVKLTNISQSIMAMNTSCKEYERMIIRGELRHDGNPAMLWQFSNLVPVRDNADNLKFTKENYDQKIDGHIANIMSIAEWMTIENSPKPINPYAEGRGAIVIRRRK